MKSIISRIAEDGDISMDDLGKSLTSGIGNKKVERIGGDNKMTSLPSADDILKSIENEGPEEEDEVIGEVPSEDEFFDYSDENEVDDDEEVVDEVPTEDAIFGEEDDSFDDEDIEEDDTDDDPNENIYEEPHKLIRAQDIFKAVSSLYAK